MRMATATAKLPIIATNRSISRWRVVIPACPADDSLAMTPLRLGINPKDRLESDENELLQNSPISGLNDKANSWTTDAMGTLESHIFRLESIRQPIYYVLRWMAYLQEIFVCHENSSVYSLTLVNNWKLILGGNMWWKENMPLQSRYCGRTASPRWLRWASSQQEPFLPCWWSQDLLGLALLLILLFGRHHGGPTHQKGACLWLKPWLLTLRNLATH